MVFQSVLKSSWLCFLVFGFGASIPLKKSQAGAGSGFGPGSSFGIGDAGSVFGPSSSFGIGDTGSGFGPGSSFGIGDAGSVFGPGSSFDTGVGSGLQGNLDAGIARIIADLLRFRPERSFPRFDWTLDQVPLGMVEERPKYPSSHVIRSSSGYQRARDLRSDAKYSMDTFDHIPVAEMQQGTGFKEVQ